jgi:PAS domain S-box-containing protein
MKIGTKLKFSAWVPALMALVIMIAMVFSFIEMKNIEDTGNNVREIRTGITELNHNVFSYILSHQDSPKQQFSTEHEALTTLIAGTRIRNPDQLRLLNNIRDNNEMMSDLFGQLVSAYEADSTNMTVQNPEIENRLEEQLIQSSYEADNDAALLRGMIDNGLRSAQIRTTAFIFLIIIIAVIPFSIILYRTRRSITSSLLKLNTGAALIGSGNLDFKIDESGNDEIGELSRAFNRMAADLKTVTASRKDLENEIAEREKAEEKLKENEQQLRQSNELLEAVTRGTGVIVAVINTDYRYIFFNKGYAEEMKKLTGKDIMLGSSMIEAFEHMPEQQKITIEEWSPVLRGLISNKTLEFGVPSVYRRVYDVLHTPIRDDSGKVIGAGEIAYDVTERRKAEDELFRVNRELRAISECNQAMVRANDEQMLLSDVCRIMCDSAGYIMAWVGQVVQDDAKSVKPLAWGGAEQGYLTTANITWADTERGRGPTGLAVRTGRTHFFQSFSMEPAAGPWREAALARGFHSSIALPLVDNGHNVFAVLTLYAGQPGAFTPSEVKLLEELAGDLAFGINVLRERVKRQQAEENLRETSDFLNNLFNNANAPIIVWNPEFKITRFNHAFENLTGRTADEVMGKNLDILFPDDNRMSSMAFISKTAVGEKWEVVEIPILNRNGTVRTVLWNSATLFSLDGKTMVATIAQGQDITERKLMEEALKESESRFFKAFNANPVAQTIADLPEGRCVEVNNSFLSMMEYTRGEVIGRTTAELNIFDQNESAQVLRVILEGGSIQNLELTARTKSGKILTVLSSNEKISLNGKDHYIATLLDISERKKAEQLKDEFIGMVSHEIRTPLTILMGAIGVAMNERITPEDSRSLLQDAMGGAESLNQIVNNLIELSRYQSDRLLLKKQLVDVAAVVRNLLEKERIRTPNHRFLLDVPEGLPRVLADEVRVELILMNLLSNAVKYSAEGTEIRVSARSENGSLLVSVSDNGIGIPEEKLGLLFQPFERLENVAMPAKGLGLGLVVCKRLAEAHGGSISVQSKEGQGTIFTFMLPL